MAIYRRDEVSPEWEPIPWGLNAAEADTQEQGFHLRALKLIVWKLAPFQQFPADGLFGQDRDWFISNDITFYATFDGEDLILIQNRWHGFPDPPEWGLASRPQAATDVKWSLWGHSVPRGTVG
jgi:hypothetical protein